MKRQERPGYARRMAGFSLIELLIVVVIIGIIAAIAIPNYQAYVREARRTDATGALLTVANNQERWFLANGSYTNNLTNVWGPPDANGDWFSLEDFYELTLPTGNATLFVVRASAVAGTSQANDDIQCVTLDSTNRRRMYVAANCSGADQGSW